ncbi:hypothetical protein A9Q75_01480 [Colwellia psychrerythraea]|uniref:Tyr recombinase domain-containing protein n=1 Tax=Colwellia psychrerythraea TaxID=28229 RepID=A0A1Y5EPU6_COLPS|nr:hypothetical protein A9Q75_01480 [Colwellia psychrerythraea]
MAKKKKVDLDTVELSLNELKSDSQEAAEYLLSHQQKIYTGKLLKHIGGGLLVKLRAAPNGDFSLTERSKYSDRKWQLPIKSSKNTITFYSDLLGSNDLKRVISYHLLPASHPFGRIRSYESSTTYASAHSYIEKYVLLPNALDGSPKSIKAISTKLLNKALDAARDDSSLRAYSFLHFYICFWIALSEQKLIPTEYRLNIPLIKIDNKERKLDIQAQIEEERIGWSPLSEDELTKLIEHSLFWTDKALPELLKIKKYIVKNDYHQQKHPAIITTNNIPELEALLGKEVDGVAICGYTMPVISQRIKGRQYLTYNYNWRKKYRLAVDKVRDGVLIILALITGLRSRELGKITFDDLILGDDLEWKLNVARFKTSDDPNFFGEKDSIPLPSILGELISEYKDLRSISGLMRNGLMFEQTSNRTLELENHASSRAIQKNFSRIGKELGLDSIHAHRFRKTIAEILIKKSERNIDLIRMLFGHKSYRMTLRYIARNPYMVSSITEAMEVHYAESFMKIVSATQNGSYSGIAAERIASSLSDRPELFKGKLFKLSIQEYLAYLLQAGVPIFIQRTTIGTYCVSTESYAESNQPPCIKNNLNQLTMPDISNCQLECANAVVLEDAKTSLEENVTFYESIIDNAIGELSGKAIEELKRKVKTNKRHLGNLNSKTCIGKERLETSKVQS